MKIPDNILWTVLAAILIVSITVVFMAAILTDASSRGDDPVEAKIINHSTHGEGYQLIDSVNHRTCVIYPDAPEPSDRLDCYGSVK